MNIINNTRCKQSWRPYDVPLKQINPARSKLVAPKPDMAFSFKMSVKSQMTLDIMEWQSNSIPGVDLCVTSRLICPFLVFESKAEHGSVHTAENRLGNAMIMMQDILCSLKVNDTLHLFGLIQDGLMLYPYISFSKRIEDCEGRTHCATVSRSEHQC